MSDECPAGVEVWLALLKTSQAIGRITAAEIQGFGLGDSDFRVLEVLLHNGSQPVNVIGPKVHLTPGSISVAVDRLHARGLVSRIEDSDDRRIRIVDLTPEGRALIVPVFQRHAEFLEKICEVLSPKERLQLEELLTKVGRKAEQMGCPSANQHQE